MIYHIISYLEDRALEVLEIHDLVQGCMLDTLARELAASEVQSMSIAGPRDLDMDPSYRPRRYFAWR